MNSLNEMSLDELLKMAGASPVSEKPKKNIDDMSLDELLNISGARPVDNSNPVQEELPDEIEWPSYVHWSGNVASKLTPEQQEIRRKFRETIPETRNRRLKLAAQAIPRALTSLPDIPQALVNLAATGANYLGAGLPTFSREQFPSHHIDEAIKKYAGIDLRAEKPQTNQEKTVESAIEGAFGALAGGGLGAAAKGVQTAAKAVPYVGDALSSAAKYASKFLGAPKNAKEASSLAGVGAGISGGLQVAENAGVDTTPLVVAASAFPVGRAAYNSKAAKYLKGKAGNLSNVLNPEKHGREMAANKIYSEIGEQNIQKAIKDIELQEARGSSYGQNPTTAEVTLSPSLAIAEDAYLGTPKHRNLQEGLNERVSNNAKALSEKLIELGDPGESGITGSGVSKKYIEDQHKLNTERAVQDFQPYSDSERSGKVLKEAFDSEYSKRTKKRTEEHGSKYEQLKNIQETLVPRKTIKFLNDKKKEYSKGSLFSNEINNILKLVEGEKSDVSSEISKLPSNISLEEYRNLQKGILSNKNRTAEKISVIETSMQQLSDKRNSAIVGGRKNEARLYGDVLKHLEMDLKKHPEVMIARKGWAEGSVLVNELDKHPLFKKFLKRTSYNSHNVVPESAIIDKILSEPSYTSDFIKVFSKNKPVMDTVKSYINGKVVNSIFDKHGNPSMDKICSFMKSNDSFFNVYPELETKLSNKQNANKFANNIAKHNLDATTEQYKDMFKRVSKGDPDRIVKRFLNAKDTDGLQMLMNSLENDTTGEATEGIRRSTMTLVSNNSKTTSKFLNFYKENVKGLSIVFGKESPQMKFLEELRNDYKRKRDLSLLNKNDNSKTTPRGVSLKEWGKLSEQSDLDKTKNNLLAITAGSLVGHGFWSKVGTAGLAGFATTWRGVVQSSMQENIQRALLDPNFAKMMMQDISTKGGLNKAIDLKGKWKKSYVNGYAITRNAPKDEDEE